MANFFDGLINIVNALANQRGVNESSVYSSPPLSDSVLRGLYKSGLGQRILDIKSGYALNETLQFESEDDEEYYKKRLAKHIKRASKWMLAFGRGIIVVHHTGERLDEPLRKVNPDAVLFSVFAGDDVNVASYDADLQSPRYRMPKAYQVSGTVIHHSRVVDFLYRRPVDLELPSYKYGGISEFETIYEQAVADMIIQRACPRIVEKASTMFYKVKGFRDKIALKQDTAIIDYFGKLESLRGIYAAGLMDFDDELQVVTQNITGLADIDKIGLRRLSMVTGIPMAVLVGEGVGGLNSAGNQERATLQDTIDTLQSEYLIEPINQLLELLGMEAVKFRENQGESALQRAEYDSVAIDNAGKLAAMGEDHRKYLADKGIISADEADADVMDDEELGNEEPQN
jgi:hypothetical protein